MLTALPNTLALANFYLLRFGHFGGRGGGGGLFLGLLAIGGIGALIWAVTRSEKSSA